MDTLATPNPWFDTPNSNPKRRRPMADLLVELAERNGDPVWNVVHNSRGAVARDGLIHSAKTDIPEQLHGTETGYNNYGCRCVPCTKARSVNRRARERRAANRNAS